MPDAGGVAPDVDQGVVFKTDLFRRTYLDSAAIVVTPKCDVWQDKADFLAVCAVTSPDAIMRLRVEWDSMPSRRSNLEDILRQKHARYHWLGLDLTAFADGAIADFQVIASVAPTSVDGASVFHRLAGPWSEELSARYAAYMGRIGVPDPEWTPQERTAHRDDLLRQFDDQSSALAVDERASSWLRA